MTDRKRTSLPLWKGTMWAASKKRNPVKMQRSSRSRSLSLKFRFRDSLVAEPSPCLPRVVGSNVLASATEYQEKLSVDWTAGQKGECSHEEGGLGTKMYSAAGSNESSGKSSGRSSEVSASWIVPGSIKMAQARNLRYLTGWRHRASSLDFGIVRTTGSSMIVSTAGCPPSRG